MQDHEKNTFDRAKMYGVYEPGEEVGCYSTPDEAITEHVKFWMQEEGCSVLMAILELGALTVSAYRDIPDEEDGIARIAKREYTYNEVRAIVRKQAPELFA